MYHLEVELLPESHVPREISTIPTYLKISKSTTSGKHSINDVGDFICLVIFVTASLPSCWARIILLMPYMSKFCKVPFHEIEVLQNIFLSHRCSFVTISSNFSDDTSTLKQFFTSSTIFSTTLYQRDEDLQQQTLHFFWEAIGNSTVTFKGLYYL